MKLRKRILPPGWYPHDEASTRRKIESLKSGFSSQKKKVIAGVVPHAGWEYSGRAALEVILTVKGPVDTCVIIGGHLPQHAGTCAAFEEAYETPFGNIPADLEVLDALKEKVTLNVDSAPDNTVEIQLPFIKYAFPDSKAVWLRTSPSEEAIALGEALYAIAENLKKNFLVLGSTDLTHYGSNYGFTPQGRGEKALQWVKEVNDKRLIDTLLALDLNESLNRANDESSACSVGGAVAAVSYARHYGISTGTLLSYYTSYDVFPHESFVGYAGIIYVTK
jgi:AmmeMemoRadiSam system protein B